VVAFAPLFTPLGVAQMAPSRAEIAAYRGLHAAAAAGDVAAIKALLGSRADAHARDGHGQTPLHVAAFAGAIEALPPSSRAAAIRGAAASPGFLVVPQNAEALLTAGNDRRSIDAIGKEDVLYGVNGGGTPNTPAHTAERVAWLNLPRAEGKPCPQSRIATIALASMRRGR
jgi:hypothetical protein